MVTKVAVGVDGSETAAKAVEMAAEVARRYAAELVLLSVLEDATATSAGQEADTTEREWASNPSARVRQILSRTEAQLRRDGLECSTLVAEGDPGDVLVRLAEESGADLLVVGNKGMHRRILGSVPNTVTHKAPCSVLVVKTT